MQKDAAFITAELSKLSASFPLVAVVIMNFCQAAVLVTLLGMVGSAPLLSNNTMDKNTIEQAHSLISKILEDIPAAHASWISTETLTLGSSVNVQLQHLKDNLIPAAPVLESISETFTLEICLDHIFKGLKLHLNLLKELSRATTLPQTDQVDDLLAEIRDLLLLINMLQNEAGFKASDRQTSEHDLDKKLTNEYKRQVTAHLTLQQLQVFSCHALRSVLSFPGMTADNSSPDQQCGPAASQ